MPIKTVGVLGCGLMGSGIAQVSAAAGYKTIVREVNDTYIEKGLARIKKFLDDGVAKGKTTADARDRTLENLAGTTTFDALKECDLIVEAVVESASEKKQTYAALERIVPERTIFVSNTSSLCITELAAATKRPDRFTSDETYQTVFAFAKSLGKEPITAPDRPGFIVNRLLVPYLLDAIRAYENGLGTLEDIDAGMKLGCGYPMGPFTLLDFVGLDTTYYIANIMFDEFREPAYAPPPLLKRMVLAGRFGRKSGHGFYKY